MHYIFRSVQKVALCLYLDTRHHFFRARKTTPRMRAIVATATLPATIKGVKFSQGQGPRAPVLDSSSSAPSPGPFGSEVASGLLGAAGAVGVGFRLL